MNEGEFRNAGQLALEMAKMRQAIESGATVYLEWSTEKKRTSQQQKAMEVFFRTLASILNDHGLDQRKVLAAMREGVELPWRQESAKELWRDFQIAVVGKESTADLEPSEVSRVYDVVNRFLIDRFGLSVQFPDRFNG